MNILSKISSVIFLIAMVIVIFFLSLSLKNDEIKEIKQLKMTGNKYLSIENYTAFAHLEDTANVKVGLSVIKNRLEKHPYILRVDIKYVSDGIAEVEIIEKEFESILRSNSGEFLITKDLEIIPLLLYTKGIDLPVISNPAGGKTIKEFEKVNSYAGIISALKIIETCRLLNNKLIINLSEINLRDGKDILVRFSSFDYPLILGRGDEVRKMIYFEKIWSYLRGKNINNEILYLDFRFDNHVYLGLSENLADKEYQI